MRISIRLAPGAFRNSVMSSFSSVTAAGSSTVSVSSGGIFNMPVSGSVYLSRSSRVRLLTNLPLGV